MLMWAASQSNWCLFSCRSPSKEQTGRDEARPSNRWDCVAHCLLLLPAGMTTGTEINPAPAGPLRIGILGSGGGSNAQSIIDAIAAKTLAATVVCVFADVPTAYILERARKYGIPSEYIDPAPFKTKLDGEAEANCIRKLKGYGANVIVLAGFMRIVKPGLLAAFPNRVLNIHPALLPAFPGLTAWKQAVDYGARVSGCTVHFVDAGMDTGPVILQRAVPVLDGDTPETLHARIQVQEHQAYPEALQLLGQGRLRIAGRRVKILDGPDVSR